MESRSWVLATKWAGPGRKNTFTRLESLGDQLPKWVVLNQKSYHEIKTAAEDQVLKLESCFLGVGGPGC